MSETTNTKTALEWMFTATIMITVNMPHRSVCHGPGRVRKKQYTTPSMTHPSIWGRMATWGSRVSQIAMAPPMNRYGGAPLRMDGSKNKMRAETRSTPCNMRSPMSPQQRLTA